jgi:hypothetical protein
MNFSLVRVNRRSQREFNMTGLIKDVRNLIILIAVQSFNVQNFLSSNANVRILTMKQLKDLITDIYAQKVKYDKKCEEN